VYNSAETNWYFRDLCLLQIRLPKTSNHSSSRKNHIRQGVHSHIFCSIEERSIWASHGKCSIHHACLFSRPKIAHTPSVRSSAGAAGGCGCSSCVEVHSHCDSSSQCKCRSSSILHALPHASWHSWQCRVDPNGILALQRSWSSCNLNMQFVASCYSSWSDLPIFLCSWFWKSSIFKISIELELESNL
jgi:hypothetical protein